MTDKLEEIWLLLICGGFFWLVGFWGQRVLNATGSTHNTLEARAVWAWLFGICPGRGRIFLRIATLQMLAIIYFFGGFIALWFWDASTVRRISLTGLAIGLLGLILGWTIIDYVARMKHRRAAERDNSTRG